MCRPESMESPPVDCRSKLSVPRRRAHTAEYDKSDASLALLCQTVVDHFFDPEEDSIGSRIRGNSVIFRVIGVLKAKGHAPEGYERI